MNAFGVFVKNNLSVMASHVLIGMQGLVMIPLIIKTAGATIYGAYSLFYTFLTIVFGISSLGVGYRAKRNLPSSDDNYARGNLFYPQLIFHLCLVAIFATIFVAFFPYVNRTIFHEEVSINSFFAIPYLFLLFVFSQSADYFRFTHRMGYFNLATAGQPYLYILLVVIVLLVAGKIEVSNLLFAQIISLAIIGLPYFYFVLREIGVKPKYYNLKEAFLDIKLGFPLVLTYIVDIIISASDRFILSYFISVTAVGYYGPAYALGSLAIFLPKVFSVVLIPLLSRIKDANKEYFIELLLYYSIKVHLALSILYFLGAMFFGEAVLAILANSEVAQEGGNAIRVVALASVFYGLNIIFAIIYFIQARTKVLFYVNFIAAFTNVVLNLIILNIYAEIVVAAMTTLVSYAIAFMISIMYVKQEIKLRMLIFDVFKIIGLSIAIFFASSILFGYTDVLIAKVAFILLVYAVGLRALDVFSLKELSLMKKKLGNI